MTVCIIIAKLSRYDFQNGGIFLGPARDFAEECLAAAGLGGATILPILAGQPLPIADHYIFTGQRPLDLYYRGQILNNVRGRRFTFMGKPAVATFSFQDCCDFRNFEGDEGEDDDDDEGTGKDTAPTKWRNYRGWTFLDIQKLTWEPPPPTASNLYRDAARNPAMCLNLLKQIPKDATIYFDIESHMPTNTLACWSIFYVKNGYGVGFGHLVYDFRGQLQPRAVEILAQLTRVLNRCEVVIHNSFFDLQFLAAFHGIPFGNRVRDTMLQHKRLYPELERSLAHCISLYTNHENHKGTAINVTHNYAQDGQLLEYNLQDVVTLAAVDGGQRAFAGNIKGSQASIDQVNATIIPYMVAGLYGMRVDEHRRMVIATQGEVKCRELNRIARILLGREIELASNVQVGKYFHQELGYPPVAKTATGEPSLKGNALYLHKLKHPQNVFLDVLLAYRETAKATSMLGFKSP